MNMAGTETRHAVCALLVVAVWGTEGGANSSSTALTLHHLPPGPLPLNAHAAAVITTCRPSAAACRRSWRSALQTWRLNAPRWRPCVLVRPHCCCGHHICGYKPMHTLRCDCSWECTVWHVCLSICLCVGMVQVLPLSSPLSAPFFDHCGPSLSHARTLLPPQAMYICPPLSPPTSRLH